MVNEFGKNYDFPVVDNGVSRGRFTKDCVIVGMICDLYECGLNLGF